MIQSLYPTHEAYVAAVAAATKYDVKKKWLLPEVAKAAIAKAEGFTAPWTLGSCYETANPAGEQTGTLSSQTSLCDLEPAVPDPRRHRAARRIRLGRARSQLE